LALDLPGVKGGEEHEGLGAIEPQHVQAVEGDGLAKRHGHAGDHLSKAGGFGDQTGNGGEDRGRIDLHGPALASIIAPTLPPAGRVLARRMVLSHGISGIDLEFLGRARAIATLLIDGADGVALVDPGPSSCLPTLETRLRHRGIGLADLTDLLITHIHLDHSGSVGVILRANPRIRVWVHERGARHLADPRRLVESASRLYGAEMDRLWGEIAPVPENCLVTLRGGERIAAAGRRFEVAYTPGHASHHVSFFDGESGLAMVGDTAGVCVDGGYVLPPTPPPDIDVEQWRESVAKIEAWSPATLFVTHFG